MRRVRISATWAIFFRITRSYHTAPIVAIKNSSRYGLIETKIALNLYKCPTEINILVEYIIIFISAGQGVVSTFRLDHRTEAFDKPC